MSGWLASNLVFVRGPFDHETAIVIRNNSAEGTVSILVGNKCITSYKTNPNAEYTATMVFLTTGYYCWCMKGAQIKLITKGG